MQPVVPSTTDVDVTIRIVDSATFLPETGVTSATAGIDLWYRKGETGAKTSLTEADYSALTDAHGDGKLLHIGDGYYRLGLPDAAVPTAENEVTVIGGTVTGMVVLGMALIGKVTPNATAPLDAAGVRAAVGLGSANLDTQLDALPTNAELATALGTADDAVLAAIAAGVPVASIAAGAITASAIAADAIGSSELAASAVAEIADQVWDEVLSGHATAGSTGAALSAAGSAGDPWSTTLPGAYSTGTAGHWIGTKLLGYIKSLTRSDYAEETDIGGTYDAASDSLEAIRDALRQGALTISNPGMVAGGFEIVAGDSYNNDDGNLPLTFTWTETAGRSFGSKSGVINGVNNAGATFAWDCTLAQASTTVTVTVEDLDSTETDLTPGADWRWMLTVTMGSGNETTPVRGTMVVLERPGA